MTFRAVNASVVERAIFTTPSEAAPGASRQRKHSGSVARDDHGDRDGVRSTRAPALARVGAEGGTTGEVIEAGNIREDMFQLLLVSDIVVGDISIDNPNVYHELGVRHALREKRTFLLRATA